MGLSLSHSNQHPHPHTAHIHTHAPPTSKPSTHATHTNTHTHPPHTNTPHTCTPICRLWTSGLFRLARQSSVSAPSATQQRDTQSSVWPSVYPSALWQACGGIIRSLFSRISFYWRSRLCWPIAYMTVGFKMFCTRNHPHHWNRGSISVSCAVYHDALCVCVFVSVCVCVCERERETDTE